MPTSIFTRLAAAVAVSAMLVGCRTAKETGSSQVIRHKIDTVAIATARSIGLERMEDEQVDIDEWHYTPGGDTPVVRRQITVKRISHATATRADSIAATARQTIAEHRATKVEPPRQLPTKWLIFTIIAIILIYKIIKK